MTKRGMRGFAAGIWVAALVMAFFVYTSDSLEKTAAKPAVITESQVDEYLDTHGQVAVSESEYENLQAKAKANEQEEKSKTAADDSDDSKSKSDIESDTKKENVRSFTLHIRSGMTGGEIAAKLEEANIIKDKFDLIHYLKKHNMEQDVQLGTVQIKSDMTIAEIAKKITS
ncbi:MAG TPA: hypothetical protein VFK44_08725 [Bacillales bacterium]|nr:hypothetical protein [Bacillales bacterium]